MTGPGVFRYLFSRSVPATEKGLNCYCCKISTDELLGVKILQQQRDPQQAALWRRLKKIESLPKRDQKALLHYLDALVQKNVAAG
jgi:hypothetical protein